MNEEDKKYEIVSFIKGFVFGYFAIEIIRWFFKGLRASKRRLALWHKTR